MTLGEKLRKVRLERGLSQTQTAGDRITRNMLSQIENGQASPSMKTLEYLAETLGVSVGWLLEDRSGNGLEQAKELLSEGRLEEALQACTESGKTGDEATLLLATIHGRLARTLFRQGSFALAAMHAENAVEANGKTLYASRDLEIGMVWILARCGLEGVSCDPDAVQKFRTHYDAAGWEARNHLLQARLHLSRQNYQAADRSLWSITVLPEDQRPEYLLLRGKLAVCQDKYSAALAFLHQAEDLAGDNAALLREIWEQLEYCSRELEDYRAAYEYAAKRREQ